MSHEIVDICVGGMHTVCLTEEGKVFTFGCNDEGALGRITVDIEDSEYTPGEVKLPGKVIQISARDSHSAALLDDGRVFAWGTFQVI
ncbi:RCC1 domain containing protein [Asbolus verrucosus]|uniref:RCC1 domain containing protein n=1 Tax=Asbolus verrucosus TaxID=1661398 RepID=A0A482W4L0_ASBVE|nr:RCC1 domain containing protein [Asbolus verrucosus]